MFLACGFARVVVIMADAREQLEGYFSSSCYGFHQHDVNRHLRKMLNPFSD